MGVQTIILEPETGASLGRAIRELANDARSVLSGEADLGVADDVLQRIDDLKFGDSLSPSAPIRGWLDSLRLQVQNA